MLSGLSHFLRQRADGDLPIRPRSRRRALRHADGDPSWRPVIFPGNRRDSRNDSLKCPIIVRRGCRFWHFWFWRAAAPRPQSSPSQRARAPQNAPRRFLRTRVREARADVGDSTAHTVAMSFGMGGGPGASPTPTTIFRWPIPRATACLPCRGRPPPTSSSPPRGRATRTTSCVTRCKPTARRCPRRPSSTTPPSCAALGTTTAQPSSAVRSVPSPPRPPSLPRPSHVRVSLLPCSPPRSPRPSLRSPLILVQAAVTTRRRSDPGHEPTHAGCGARRPDPPPGVDPGGEPFSSRGPGIRL